MKHLLKVVLLCLLLLITACDSSSPSNLIKTPEFQSDMSIEISNWQKLDGKPLDQLLVQLVIDTHRLNTLQTQIILQTLEKNLRIECREYCKVKALDKLK